MTRKVVPSRPRVARIKRPRTSSVALPAQSRFDPDQIQKILQAVVDAGGTVSANLFRVSGWQDMPLRERNAEMRRCADARDELAEAIGWAFTWLGLHDDLHSEARAKQRATALRDVVKLSRQLLHRLTDQKLSLQPGIADHMPKIAGTETVVNGHVFVRRSSVTAAVDGVLNLQKAAECRLQWLKKAGLDQNALFPQSEASGATPEYYVALKNAYTDFISTEWAIERSSREAKIGPEIAFIIEVQRQGGQTEQTPSAILKAFQRLKLKDKRPKKS